MIPLCKKHLKQANFNLLFLQDMALRVHLERRGILEFTTPINTLEDFFNLEQWQINVIQLEIKILLKTMHPDEVKDIKKTKPQNFLSIELEIQKNLTA